MRKVVLVLGDDVSTDVIYPGGYMATVLPAETPQFAFADDLAFSQRLGAKQVAAGSVIVAGRSFGCGSSREQAVSCLQGHGLTVIAKGFARIFLQNAINLGLQVVLAPEIDAREGDEIEIEEDRVVSVASGRSARIVAFPRARRAVIEAGGLVPYTRRRVVERAQAAPR